MAGTGFAMFTLRPAKPEDRKLIDFYSYREGMDNIPTLENVMVAVNADNQCVGFCRVAYDKRGVAYVNPVVTNPQWRGYGVGRALVEDALRKNGEIRLVARGGSVAFYRALGFVEIPWEAVDLSVTENCDGCPMWGECRPLPMGKRLGD